ncbi:MAG: hypothetical protein ACHQYQ_00680 [Bacteriovoracales bacterium]
MFIYKAGMILSVELIVIAIGFYFFYLAKRENSKHLKIGAYILVVGGIIIALGTSAMTIKKIACKKRHHCEKCHHEEGKDWEGKPQCLDKDKMQEGEGERTEKED